MLEGKHPHVLYGYHMLEYDRQSHDHFKYDSMNMLEYDRMSHDHIFFLETSPKPYKKPSTGII